MGNHAGVIFVSVDVLFTRQVNAVVAIEVGATLISTASYGIVIIGAPVKVQGREVNVCFGTEDHLHRIVNGIENREGRCRAGVGVTAAGPAG